MKISDHLTDIGPLSPSLTPHMDVAKKTIELADAKTAEKRAMPGPAGALARLQQRFYEAYAFGQASELDAGMSHGQVSELMVKAIADTLVSLALSYTYGMPIAERAQLLAALLGSLEERAFGAVMHSDELHADEVTGVLGPRVKKAHRT
jgi:hypothetical protein